MSAPTASPTPPSVGPDARPAAPWVAALPLADADAACARAGQSEVGPWVHVRRLWGRRPVAGQPPARAPRIFGASDGRARLVRVVEQEGWLGVDLYADRPSAGEPPILVAYGQLPSSAEADRAGALPLITVQRISAEGMSLVAPSEAAGYLSALAPTDATAQAQCTASIRHYEALARRALTPAPDVAAVPALPVFNAAPLSLTAETLPATVPETQAPAPPIEAGGWSALTANAPAAAEVQFAGPHIHPSLQHMETVTRLLLVCDDAAVAGGLTRLASKLRSPFALVPRDAVWLAEMAAKHADRLRLTSLWQCRSDAGAECWVGSAPTPDGYHVIVATGPEAGLSLSDEALRTHGALAWAARQRNVSAPTLAVSGDMAEDALAPVFGLHRAARPVAPRVGRLERLEQAAAADAAEAAASAAAATASNSRFRDLSDEVAPTPALPAALPSHGPRTWRSRPV